LVVDLSDHIAENSPLRQQPGAGKALRKVSQVHGAGWCDEFRTEQYDPARRVRCERDPACGECAGGGLRADFVSSGDGRLVAAVHAVSAAWWREW
jgi:hypothetical protein